MAAVAAAVDESKGDVKDYYGLHQDKATKGEDTEQQETEPYYWQEGGDADADWWAKVRHHLHYGGIMALSGAEAVGEVVASTLGLTDSKYQYVIDALESEAFVRKREEREQEERRKIESERQHRLLQENGGVINFQPKDAHPDGGDDGIELGETSISSYEKAQHKPGTIVDVPLA